MNASTSGWITGLGVVAPNGVGTDAYWAATLEGRSGLRPIEAFDAEQYPVHVAGEVGAFDDAQYLSSRLLPQTDRMTRYALVASDWALQDSGARPAEQDEFATGVITASAAGGFEFGQRELQKLWGSGPGKVSAYQSFAWFYAVNTGQISIRHGLRGHSSVAVAEQAGGLDAAAQATRLVDKGTLRTAITGGFEASVCPWGLVAQIPSGLLSTERDSGRAYVPFDPDATGWVPGEGGAALIVERAADARARAADHVYGRIAGHASTFDPRPGLRRPPALARAIRLALDRARLEADDIDVVFADAAGVPQQDRAEVAALAEVFGPANVPVTAPKTMTGRLYSGGGALDVATALLALRDGVIPPTVGTRDAPAELDLVLRHPRQLPLKNAVVIARGTGGFNSAVVLTRV
ncbi:ketosynthase chain-length factor [Streptomyces sp. TLI_185]|uniref:ketosynthase chain-length factor n=1 Tax=Streptomyces sp. TLI_185 TaxID=2485151 RepID=UPI000FB21887|nr:ketosynthase chain-length factor [Streptomyces sp. TLI_185]RPF24893.1 act minimal PKS chain-length factor (CLF/KS beta) [Streptomyces sp. TLI_185]